MKVPAEMPWTATAIKYAPDIPAVSKTTTNTGTIASPASTLGTSRYWIGFTAMVSKASICSVTRIVPSSVHIAETARIVTISELNTGDNSRVMVIATVGPTKLSALKIRNAPEV